MLKYKKTYPKFICGVKISLKFKLWQKLPIYMWVTDQKNIQRSLRDDVSNSSLRAESLQEQNWDI